MNKTENITHPKVTEYINRFYRLAEPELMELRLAAEAEGVPIILRETSWKSGQLSGIPQHILQRKQVHMLLP